MTYAVHSRSFAAPAISRPGALRFGGDFIALVHAVRGEFFENVFKPEAHSLADFDVGEPLLPHPFVNGANRDL
jgi:hypothetical protein